MLLSRVGRQADYSLFSAVACPRGGSAGRQRAGAILPLVAVLMIPCMGFLALAIDLGILCAAMTQAQQAADLGALTACRSLTGASGYNQSGATTNAGLAVGYNVIYGQKIQTGTLSTTGYTAISPSVTVNGVNVTPLTLTYGTYDYVPANQAFVTNFPPTANEALSAVKAQVTYSVPTAFGRIFLMSGTLGSVTANATAVHRPRDLALVMDRSTSMRFATLLRWGNNNANGPFDPSAFPGYAAQTVVTNNNDTLVPNFGQYQGNGAFLTYSGATITYDSYSIPGTNNTAPTPSYLQIYANSFYQNAASTSSNPNPTLSRAFDSYQATYNATTSTYGAWTANTTQLPQLPSGGSVLNGTTTTPSVNSTHGTTWPASGDYPLFTSGSTSAYATNVQDATPGSANRYPAWELDGYSNTSAYNNTTLGTLNPATDQVTVNNNLYYINQPSYYGLVINPGSGYTTAPAVSISGGPFATAPTATAYVYQGQVGIALTSNGTLTAGTTSYNNSGGYSTTTPATVTISGNAVTSGKIYPFSGYTQGPGFYGKTFFTWPPDPRRPLYTSSSATTTPAWWNSTNGYSAAGDTAIINQFLSDFGFQALDISCPATGVAGLYNGSFNNPAPGGGGVLAGNSAQLWPWPNDGGVSLSYYLTNNVWIPGSAQNATSRYPTTSIIPSGPYSGSNPRLLKITDPQYSLIMRLYNWNYVVDNYNPNASGILYPGTTPCDWRLRFFGTNNNSTLFSSSGLNNPGGYTINYNEILRWLAQANNATNPFPQALRGGRTRYYGSFPTQLTGSWPSYGSTDQRFMKEVIDYCLGFYQNSSGSYAGVKASDNNYTLSSSNIVGYGSDINWGTFGASGPPAGAIPYMSYTDNPIRGLLRYWIGPLNLTDYTNNLDLGERYSQSIDSFNAIQGYSSAGAPHNWFSMSPGDGYEAPLYSGKQAFSAAIGTMQNNHPNDWFTTIAYGTPRSNSTYTQSGSTYAVWGTDNCARAPLGTYYSYANASLYFPFSTIAGYGAGGPAAPTTTPGTISASGEVTPYTADPVTGTIPSANFIDVFRGDGDTCFSMGLMLAYNQLVTTPPGDSLLRTFVSNIQNPPSGYPSGKTPIDFLPGTAGGMGRKGAQKVVVFETDGEPNCLASAGGSGANGLYSVPTSTANYSQYSPSKFFPIRYDMNKPNSVSVPATPGSGSEYPSVTPSSDSNAAVLTQVQNLVTQMNTDMSTTRNPFKLYALGFGPVFTGTSANQAISNLQNMQSAGGNPPWSSSQIVTGTDAQMLTNMSTAYTTILQSGVQIALIK